MATEKKTRTLKELEEMARIYMGAFREDYDERTWEELEDAYWAFMLYKMKNS